MIREGSLPATHGLAMPAVADAALAGEPVADLSTQHGDRRAGLATLIGENHRDAEIHGDFRGNCAGEGADVAE